MKIGVTGCNGRLGKALVEYGCIPLNCDVRSVSQILHELHRVNPDVIIHCAAITDVDKSETEYFSLARWVNETGTSNLRQVYEGRIIYISTDYVFDGVSGPYSENDTPSPIGNYGYSKWRGERVIISYNNPSDTIVRTTILYGGDKQDFVTALLSELKTKDIVRVTPKLYGNPTYIYHLVEALLKLCYENIAPRIVNIAGLDVINRYEFAKKIAQVWGYSDTKIIPDENIEVGYYRPLKAGLITSFASKLGLPIYTVDAGLEEYYHRMTQC
jgi:dTDP-4-dehydrorhamnose reductase